MKAGGRPRVSRTGCVGPVQRQRLGCAAKSSQVPRGATKAHDAVVGAGHEAARVGGHRGEAVAQHRREGDGEEGAVGVAEHVGAGGVAAEVAPGRGEQRAGEEDVVVDVGVEVGGVPVAGAVGVIPVAVALGLGRGREHDGAVNVCEGLKARLVEERVGVAARAAKGQHHGPQIGRDGGGHEHLRAPYASVDGEGEGMPPGPVREAALEGHGLGPCGAALGAGCARAAEGEREHEAVAQGGGHGV